VIILDTNVLSELMRSKPDPKVLGWLDRQAPQSVWITTVTYFESRLGLASLPAGRRRNALESAFADVLSKDLEDRVLPFDVKAAAEAAALAAARQRAGRPVDIRDTQIAGIAQARRATLATRNFRHFDDLTVPVVDPWA
jgi:predicted nucleic acid-binding protein